MSGTLENTGCQHLNSLDPELPFLASQAAVELDNLILGQEVELKAVKDLARRLECATEPIEGSQNRRSLMDPTMVSVFSNAITASGLARVRTLADLAGEAWQIANALQSSRTNSDQQQVERLKMFCNCLAQNAVAYERTFHEMHTGDNNWS